MIRHKKIKRLIPMWLLILTFLLNFFVLAGCVAWLFIQFDIPFLNSGDKIAVYLGVLLWWVLTSISIWGWKYDN